MSFKKRYSLEQGGLRELGHFFNRKGNWLAERESEGVHGGALPCISSLVREIRPTQ